MHVKHEPPEETDGPPGAMALAAFLQALEEDVSMAVDQRALSLFEKLVEEALEQGEQWDGGRRGGGVGVRGPAMHLSRGVFFGINNIVPIYR